MNLLEIWEESKSLKKSICLSYRGEEAYMYKGIKITKIDDEIKIFNTAGTRIQYSEMNEEYYQLFKDIGFRDAIHIFLKKSYKERIAVINNSIKEEVNSRNNKKHYDALKFKRETLINKYSNLNKL